MVSGIAVGVMVGVRVTTGASVAAGKGVGVDGPHAARNSASMRRGKRYPRCQRPAQDDMGKSRATLFSVFIAQEL